MPEREPLNFETPNSSDSRPEMLVAAARRAVQFGVVIPLIAFAGSLIAFGAWFQAARGTPIGASAKKVCWLGVAIGFANTLVIISLTSICAMRVSSAVARVHCPLNLRQIGLAIEMYTKDNAGTLPQDFGAVLATQDITTYVFVCPASNDMPATPPPNPTATQWATSVVEGTSTCSYFYRPPEGTRASQLTPRHVISYEKPTNHNGDGVHILFGDWRVEWVPKGQFEQIIAEVEAGQNPPPSVK